MFSPSIKRLIDALTCLPGVGPKSAQRMTFHLLSPAQQDKSRHLVDALSHALDTIGRCTFCQTYSETTHCHYCESTKRDASRICVVETPADILAIEQTNLYHGRYFVLHGHLSPLDGIGPKELNIPLLTEHLRSAPCAELIIATNPTAEGKATAHYIAGLAAQFQVPCTRIAHGVPLGGELEYLDSATLTHALHGRHTIE